MLMVTEAQPGEWQGTAPPLAPERGVGPPLQNEKKDRQISVSHESGIIKPKELL